MFFAVISIMPQMFTAISEHGITSRAIKNGQVSFVCINPRDFTIDNYHRIDDRPFGGGPGMVMMAEPLQKAILYAKQLAGEYFVKQAKPADTFCPVVYLSPQGRLLGEETVVQMSQSDGMILLCGRYEGIDERIIEQYVDSEISIGDYVLTGGELPAMVLMDSVIRRLPSVMNEQSAHEDSFVDGLLDCPHYTKPVDFCGQRVPDVLLSGHHANIAKWRFLQQAVRTKARRPDLWENFDPNKQQQKWLKELDNP